MRMISAEGGSGTSDEDMEHDAGRVTVINDDVQKRKGILKIFFE